MAFLNQGHGCLAHEVLLLAPVIELSKKDRDYTCGACHVTLPYHLVVNLHSNDTGIQQCPNCDRILYLEPAEAEV